MGWAPGRLMVQQGREPPPAPLYLQEEPGAELRDVAEVKRRVACAAGGAGRGGEGALARRQPSPKVSELLLELQDEELKAVRTPQQPQLLAHQQLRYVMCEHTKPGPVCMIIAPHCNIQHKPPTAGDCLLTMQGHAPQLCEVGHQARVKALVGCARIERHLHVCAQACVRARVCMCVCMCARAYMGLHLGCLAHQPPPPRTLPEKVWLVASTQPTNKGT